MNEEKLYLLNKHIKTLNDINYEDNVDTFFSKNNDLKNVQFLIKVLIENKKLSCYTLKLKNSKILSFKQFSLKYIF